LYTALYFLAEIKSIHERKIYPKKTDTSNSQVISGYHFSLQKYHMNNLKPVRPIFPTISPLKAWLARVTSRSSLVPVISGGMQQVTGKTQVDNVVCRMLVRGLLVPSEREKRALVKKQSFHGVSCSPKEVGLSAKLLQNPTQFNSKTLEYWTNKVTDATVKIIPLFITIEYSYYNNTHNNNIIHLYHSTCPI
jgi:hypothetical protein